MSCPNCETPRIMTDHCHHYPNQSGGITTTWWIDGKTFLTPQSVKNYLKETYGFTPVEVVHFLRKIESKYN